MQFKWIYFTLILIKTRTALFFVVLLKSIVCAVKTRFEFYTIPISGKKK